MRSDSEFEAALAAVPWGDLTHAYGSAQDLPEAFRELRRGSSEGADIDQSVNDFFGSIYHQGTVYTATPYAVPFLVDIAGDGRCTNRPLILALLHAIANRDGQTSPDRAASEAVAIWFDRFVAMTDEPDATIRLAAAHVLVAIRNERPRAATRIRALLKRSDDATERTGLVCLFGRCDDRTPETLEALDASCKIEGPERLAAAIALTQLHQRMPATAREALFEWILDGEWTTVADLPWDTEAEQNVDDVANILDQADRAILIDRLLTIIEGGAASSLQTDFALGLIFGRQRSSAKIDRLSDLLATERRAILAVVPYVLTGRRVMYNGPQHYGLPSETEKSTWEALART